MSYSKRSRRYSRSPSPYRRYSRSRSFSRSVSRSRSRSRDSSEVENPGNNLYVTGLSPRITKRELEKHFSNEGTVVDVHLVVDPWTRESRGFGFVTMSSIGEANRCVKYLDRSVLEGRVITVEKARRRRGRTPTPGRYLGLRTVRVRRRSPSYSPYRRSLSPHDSSERDRSRSFSPYYSRRSRRRSLSRSRSPYSRSPVARRDRSYSPYDRRDRSYSPYGRRDRSYSPYSKCEQSYSPYDSRYYSPDYSYYRRSRYRSISRSISPRMRRSSRRSYSRSVSARPRPRRSSRRSYSRSISPRPQRSSRRRYSNSIPPEPSRSSRSVSRRASSKHDRRSYYRSPSASASPSPSSRSASRSLTPRSASPSP